jgi:hypothetical protein
VRVRSKFRIDLGQYSILILTAVCHFLHLDPIHQRLQGDSWRLHCLLNDCCFVVCHFHSIFLRALS